MDIQTLTLAGKRFVIVEEKEYRRLCQQTNDWEPPMPVPDAGGNYPADETLAVILARKIIRRRRAAGWSQEELAKRAGIRLVTLRRLEQGQSSGSVATVEKIDRALRKAEARNKK